MWLPYELLDQILCRLPVKPLLRFRCVSKGWCSLIDSNAFVKKHLKNTCDCNGVGVLVIYGDGVRFWLADSWSLDDGYASVVEINDPIKTLVIGSEYCGAANALLCVAKNEVNEIFLLNPSTRKVKKLPSAPPEFPRSFHGLQDCMCGFGYDHVNDDYKVVKIAQCIIQRGFMVIVYSLKTNSWTWIQDVPSHYFLSKWGMFGSGALYWSLMKNSGHGTETIVSFDLELEQFQEVPFPAVNENFVQVNKRTLVPPPVGESLCLLDAYPDFRVDVWLMNKYRTKNPWYKAFSVVQLCPLEFGVLRPLAFSRSRKDVLLEVDSEKLVWYNLERKAVKNLGLPRIPIRFGALLCTESLLQITEAKSLQKPSQDKLEKKQKEKRDDFLSRGFNLRL